MQSNLSRRRFIAQSVAFTTAGAIAQGQTAEPLIDIHQHVNYSGRTDEQLLAHQRMMGVTHTVLLPAGTPVISAATHQGKSNGLAAKTGGNALCLAMAQAHPKEFFFGANEVTDQATAIAEIEKYLKLGAVVIGEQKFAVECDSPASQKLYELAAAYDVPILLHFQHLTYNLGYDRMHMMLAKYPKTKFIGHAQTFWANIDKDHDWKDLYPKGKLTPGGLTDRYLADYPNMFADMSAGSGLNALQRDEDHTRGFLRRHQDKILYGSDCNDKLGRGPGCQGANTLETLRKLAPDATALRKICYQNAQRVLRLSLG